MNDFEMNQPLPPFTEPEIEVTLAKPWRRIVAVLLNGLFNVLVVMPFMVWMMLTDTDYSLRTQGLESAESQPSVMIYLTMLAAVLIYGGIQLFLMARDGQSLGKKVMRIRVLKQNGTNPGFFGTVFMREMLLGLIFFAVIFVTALLLGDEVAAQWGNIGQLGIFVANLVMLFRVQNDYRTIPDLLADTVVVQLPKA